MYKYRNINGMNVKGNHGVSYNDPNFSMNLDKFKIYIIKENGKHGIVSGTSENVVLPIEYDDVSLASASCCDDTYVFWYIVQKGGKTGLFAALFDAFEEDSDEKYDCSDATLKIVVDCECDCIIPNGRCFILCDDKGYRYLVHDCDGNDAIYNISEYYKHIFQADKEEDYLHTYDDEKHHIVKIGTWTKVETIYETDADSDCFNYRFIGSDNFVNYAKRQLLIKDKEPIQFRAWNITPITLVNSRYKESKNNIANIFKVCEETGLVGAVDCNGEVLFEPEYDEIIYELKLTASKNGEKIEKVIPIGREQKDSFMFI